MRTIITTMRNEAPFILEWLAYHRAIGFTDFVIFTNDCEDGTDQMLDRLQQMGLVHHLPNPRRGKKPVQWTALKRAANHPAVKKAEWIFVTDVDEFLNIHLGAGHLDDLLGAYPDADGFLLSWRMFGANAKIAFEDRPVLEQFTAAGPEQMIWPWRAVQFKTLFRNPGPDDLQLGIHQPKFAKTAQSRALHWIDDTGTRTHMVPGTVMLHQKPRYQIAQINHYALGSVENFLVKCARGKPNHSDDMIDLAYWLDRNLNEAEDRSILRHQAAIAEGFDNLLADPVLADLHQRGVVWRQQKFKDLMLVSDMFYLYARIVQSAPTRALPILHQQRLLNGLFTMRYAKRTQETA
jgi:hypothetical protein